MISMGVILDIILVAIFVFLTPINVRIVFDVDNFSEKLFKITKDIVRKNDNLSGDELSKRTTFVVIVFLSIISAIYYVVCGILTYRILEAIK